MKEKTPAGGTGGPESEAALPGGGHHPPGVRRGRRYEEGVAAAVRVHGAPLLGGKPVGVHRAARLGAGEVRAHPMPERVEDAGGGGGGGGGAGVDRAGRQDRQGQREGEGTDRSTHQGSLLSGGHG